MKNRMSEHYFSISNVYDNVRMLYGHVKNTYFQLTQLDLYLSVDIV